MPYLDRDGLEYFYSKIAAALNTKADNMVVKKTFENVVCTGNSDPAGWLYFGKVFADSYYEPWMIRYRVHSTMHGQVQGSQYADVMLVGMKNTYYAYRIYNAISNGSYRSYYAHVSYHTTEAGFNSGYPHLLGFRFQSAYNPTTAANARDIRIEILECKNCSFEFFDTMTLYSSVPGTGSTNYVNRYSYDGTTNGVTAYGDRNTSNYVTYQNNLYARAAITANTLVVGDDTGYETARAGVSFSLAHPLLWSASAYSSGSNGYSGIYLQYYDLDLATWVSGFSSSKWKEIYLVTTVDGDTATIDSSVITDTLPSSDDGKVYIALGRLGNQTNGHNYFLFQLNHPMFWYKNGKVRQYTSDAATVSGHTVAKDVPSNAVFTDTVYSLPAATSSVRGGVKVGSNITLSSDTISITATDVAKALGFNSVRTSKWSSDAAEGSWLIGLVAPNDSTVGWHYDSPSSGKLSQVIDGYYYQNEGAYRVVDTSDVDKEHKKIISMGEQLIINGNGLTGDNTNFSMFTFTGEKANGSPGSFTYTFGVKSTCYCDEFFPVNPNENYELSIDAITQNGLMRNYAFIDFFDVDKKQITSADHMYFSEPATLAQDLKNGDTVVYFEDLSMWKNSGVSYDRRRGFIFWNYTNSFGYTYPEKTYSRYHWSTLYNDSDVDKANNKITLKSAWNHGTFSAGTKVSMPDSGSTYKYIALINTLVPTVWTTYKGCISGTDYTGLNVSNKFPPGCAYGRLGFLWNYNTVEDQLWVTNCSFKTVDNDTVYTLPTATSSVLGGVKITSDTANSFINALSEGTSAANINDYIVAQFAAGGTSTTTYHRRKLSKIFEAIPTASSSQAGVIKVGTNLSISNGVLSATDTTYSVFSTSANGLVPKPSASSTTTFLNASGTWTTPAGTYSLPTASSSTLGGIKVGSNLSISNGVLSATNTTYSVFSTSANGLVPKPGSGDTEKFLKGDGTWATVSSGGTYTLPKASASELGGIKVGTNLSIDSNGVLSATDTVYSLPTASSSVLGGVKVGSNLSIDSNGVLSGKAGTVTSVTIKATSPISIDSTSAITGSGTRTISHANSGVTAASKGDTSNQTPDFGGTFKVPSGTVNATGHLTAFADHTVTIPSLTKAKIVSALGTEDASSGSTDIILKRAYQSWGTTLKVKLAAAGHALVIYNQATVYILWMAGSDGSVGVNATRIYGSTNLTFALSNRNVANNTLTITAPSTGSITCIYARGVITS